MWFVDNIDGIFSEFKERKIELADDLRTHTYGLREFAFVDINGYYVRGRAGGQTMTLTLQTCLENRSIIAIGQKNRGSDGCHYLLKNIRVP